MLLQIAIGTCVMIGTITLGAASLFVLETALGRVRRWFVTEPHWPKLVVMVIAASLWAMAILTVGVWLWALAFLSLGVFPDLEHAVYFSMVSFTTLGYGDVLLPVEWRILGGFAAANGLLNFGLITAILVEGLRDLRVEQARRQRGAIR